MKCKYCDNTVRKYYKECPACLNLRWRYGITGKDREQMLIDQNNKCKCCETELTKDNYRVDHCHTTGRVRGMLCSDCNLSLGHYEKIQKKFKSIIQYLMENK